MPGSPAARELSICDGWSLSPDQWASCFNTIGQGAVYMSQIGSHHSRHQNTWQVVQTQQWHTHAGSWAHLSHPPRHLIKGLSQAWTITMGTVPLLPLSLILSHCSCRYQSVISPSMCAHDLDKHCHPYASLQKETPNIKVTLNNYVTDKITGIKLFPTI